MNKCFSLSSPEFPEITLCTITKSDLENSRTWKNQHRNSFFFQDIISQVDQVKWFQGYLDRLDDHMFVIVVEGQSIGCLGFRYINGQVDIYNVIRGVPSVATRGFMGKALRMMCSCAWERYPGVQSAKVLRNNPAINWYNRNGFKTVSVYAEYVEVELDLNVFTPCPLKVIEMD